MSAVEFVAVRVQPVSARIVAGFEFDDPILGSRHRAEAVPVKGWLVGGQAPAVAIEAIGDAGPIGRIPLGYWREDIAAGFPAVAGAERSGFRGILDLRGADRVVQFSVWAVFPDGSRVPLASIVAVRVPAATQRPATARRSDPASPADATARHATPSAAPQPDPSGIVLPPGTVSRASVVVPVHNQSGLTRACLEALLAPGAARAPFETIVVDDASTDDTPDVLRAFAGRIRAVRLSPNGGFGAACNTGAALAASPHVVFLNNDTIPLPGWLDALLAEADRHPAAAVVGARLLWPDGTVQHAGVAIGTDGFPHHLYAGFPGDHPAVLASRRMRAVTAACMLVRSGAFRAVGGFDRGFVNGWEDVDLCQRLGAVGHETRYCAEAVVLHRESASRDPRAHREQRNRDRWAERWLGEVPPDCVEYWIADGLLTVESIGRLYPMRVRHDANLAVCEPFPDLKPRAPSARLLALARGRGAWTAPSRGMLRRRRVRPAPDPAARPA